MPARKYRDVRSTGFSAGVVAPEALRNPNIFRQALKTGRNCFLTNTSTITRRPGSSIVSLINQTDETPAVEDRVFPGVVAQGSGRIAIRHEMLDDGQGTLYHMFFYNGGVNIFDDTGGLIKNIVGPWVTSDLYRMAIVHDVDKVFVVSQSFWPFQLTRNITTDVWTGADYAFAEDPTGRRASPFERFLDGNITLTPSAYTGSINVTFSEDVLTADYIGVRFVVAFGAQIEITAVTDAQNGTAEVKGTIFPTQTVTVDDGSSFLIGDLVAGDVSAVEGQVVAKTGNELTVVNLRGFTLFQGETTVDATTVPGERISGPNGNAVVTTAVKAANPSGTNIWFEEIVSDARGYPGAACLHRSRLIFGGFPELPSFIAASASDTTDDFDIGVGNDDDAIIEGIGRNKAEQVLHLVSMEQLVVLTNKRALYVPEQAQQRFTPTGIEFDPIGPEQAGYQQPTVSTEGVIFIDVRDRIVVLSLTGSNRGSWAAIELTRLGYTNLKTPISVVFSAGISGRPERVLSVLNDDGTMAVFTYARGAEQGGWVPWDRPGSWHTIAAYEGNLYCLAGPMDELALEVMTFDAVLDGQHKVAPGLTIPSKSYHQLSGRHVIGDYIAPEAIEISALIVGNDFGVEIEPAPYANENVGHLLRKIYEAKIGVLDTGTYRVDGELQQGYDYTTQPEGPPPVTTRTDEMHPFGSAVDKTIKIEQRVGEGAPFHLRELTMLTRGG